MSDSDKLYWLADACSDLVYGGELGWERVEFKKFVNDVRQCLGKGNKCRHMKRENSSALIEFLDEKIKEEEGMIDTINTESEIEKDCYRIHEINLMRYEQLRKIISGWSI